MPYVTLLEASQIVHRETGVDITVSQLIRAGAVQNLPLCVLLDVKCYSPTHRIRREKKAEELDPDYWLTCCVPANDDADVVYAYGRFVLPPRHVFQYQTKETVRVHSVSSLDGQDTYCPGVDVSRDALQIMLPHLDAFIAHIKATQSAQQQTAPATDTATPAPLVTVGASSGAPMLKQPAQEARILELLTSKGHDPLNLADRQPGRKGSKSEIRTLALLEPALFTKKTFDTAWQRLREEGRLAGGN